MTDCDHFEDNDESLLGTLEDGTVECAGCKARFVPQIQLVSVEGERDAWRTAYQKLWNDRVEIRMPGGELDEIVGYGGFHVEQMDDNYWFFDLAGCAFFVDGKKVELRIRDYDSWEAAQKHYASVVENQEPCGECEYDHGKHAEWCSLRYTADIGARRYKLRETLTLNAGETIDDALERMLREGTAEIVSDRRLPKGDRYCGTDDDFVDEGPHHEAWCGLKDNPEKGLSCTCGAAERAQIGQENK